MSQFKRIGIDTSKAIFTLHCVDDAGRAVLQTSLRRDQMPTFFGKLPPRRSRLKRAAALIIEPENSALLGTMYG